MMVSVATGSKRSQGTELDHSKRRVVVSRRGSRSCLECLWPHAICITVQQYAAGL